MVVCYAVEDVIGLGMGVVQACWLFIGAIVGGTVGDGVLIDTAICCVVFLES